MSEPILLEGEHIILDVAPTPGFRKYVTIKALVGIIFFLGMVNVIVSMAVYVAVGGALVTEVGVGPLVLTYFTLLIVFSFIAAVLTYIVAGLMFKKYRYWVTNKRVIWRHGIFGYKITSVPLERISDVEVSRTFLESICGVAGLVIRRMTVEGEMHYPYVYGIRLFPTMIAVPNPEEMQRQILELIGRKGKESKLTV